MWSCCCCLVCLELEVIENSIDFVHWCVLCHSYAVFSVFLIWLTVFESWENEFGAKLSLASVDVYRKESTHSSFISHLDNNVIYEKSKWGYCAFVKCPLLIHSWVLKGLCNFLIVSMDISSCIAFNFWVFSIWFWNKDVVLWWSPQLN